MSSDSTATTDIAGPEPPKKKVKHASVEPSSGPITVRTRDHKYYFEDGNIILLVEDTLFNVHRSLLAQDSSIFGSTFSLPVSQTTSSDLEGSSDDSPFLLPGESAENFRLLLMALYGLPGDILKLFSLDGKFNELVEIALISNKYAFKDIETAAVNLLTGKLQVAKYPLDFDFLPLLHYAAISNKTVLREETLKVVRGLILKGTIDFIHVICFTEGRSDKFWRSLRGLAIYYYVVKGPTRWSRDSYRDRLPKPTGILLHISYSTLVDMRESGISWDHTCGDTARCVPGWLNWLQTFGRGHVGPAAFVSWVRYTFAGQAPSKPCWAAAKSRYEAQASALEAGSLEFFEKLQW
ncbi:hypothetical protein BOTBODRAFT_171575 [Botryobasidium botryosum FD-172 SS1]|uniref:BTB domain-containing protein n=1 Tax=Botryobasidium botryosum (strain FD-172 SS1) TaxID=930990 RepID=A0A067MT56_BOTB1|nr:hypothetical protein BOTBODRAFT_171575 [Botryobasidium botryosum FD-172 SS1]